jgi:hypothetical protein
MIGFIALQVSSFLEVVPAWLPVVTISGGICLLFAGMSNEYLSYYVGHWSAYKPQIGFLLTVALTGSIVGATYVTVIQADLVLLFVFFTFISGQLIQGAVAARIIQKVLDALTRSEGETEGGLLSRWIGYVVNKVKDRLIIIAVTGIISTHTTLSILAVFVIGDGRMLEAIERFWTGFLLLTIAGLSFDFRYFAHRLSWTVALGLVVAASGAFLYSPVGFSNLTAGLAPYLDNPVPDWMRLPLGAFGFFAGVMFWAIFYVKIEK